MASYLARVASEAPALVLFALPVAPEFVIFALLVGVDGWSWVVDGGPGAAVLEAGIRLGDTGRGGTAAARVAVTGGRTAAVTGAGGGGAVVAVRTALGGQRALATVVVVL